LKRPESPISTVGKSSATDRPAVPLALPPAQSDITRVVCGSLVSSECIKKCTTGLGMRVRAIHHTNAAQLLSVNARSHRLCVDLRAFSGRSVDQQYAMYFLCRGLAIFVCRVPCTAMQQQLARKTIPVVCATIWNGLGQHGSDMQSNIQKDSHCPFLCHQRALGRKLTRAQVIDVFDSCVCQCMSMNASVRAQTQPCMQAATTHPFSWQRPELSPLTLCQEVLTRSPWRQVHLHDSSNGKRLASATATRPPPQRTPVVCWRGKWRERWLKAAVELPERATSGSRSRSLWNRQLTTDVRPCGSNGWLLPRTARHGTACPHRHHLALPLTCFELVRNRARELCSQSTPGQSAKEIVFYLFFTDF
jgi:hypothetical protein